MQIWRFSHPRLRFFFYVWLGLAAWRPRSKAGSPPSQAPPSYSSLSPLRPSSGLRPPAAPVAARYGPFSPTAPHTCPHQLCSALRASPSRFALLAAPPLRALGVPAALHFGADLSAAPGVEPGTPASRAACLTIRPHGRRADQRGGGRRKAEAQAKAGTQADDAKKGRRQDSNPGSSASQATCLTTRPRRRKTSQTAGGSRKPRERSPTARRQPTPGSGGRDFSTTPEAAKRPPKPLPKHRKNLSKAWSRFLDHLWPRERANIF